jgi:hypothetical protein
MRIESEPRVHSLLAVRKEIVMSTSTTAMAAGRQVAQSTASTYGREFWEHLWRTAGLQSAGLFVVAYVVNGYQPLIAAIFSGLAILNLMWFAAAIRATLADVEQDGWGAAATASSAALGALLLLLVSAEAALDYSIVGLGNKALTSGLNDFVWAGVVLTSFPRAMLIMAGTFGLWRAGLISNAQFGAGVAAVVLVLAGGTTWMSSGVWAPSGAYSRFISPAIALVWIVAVSRVLLTRGPATRAAW